MNAPTLLLLTSLISTFTLPASADLCRWTDENGTVHFAERCPEGAEGTSITIDPGPSAAGREDAARLSETLQRQRSSRAQLADQQQAAQAAERQSRMADFDAARADCERAWRELEILALAVPIYREPGGRLYYRGALHDHWFQGERRYLDDSERERERQSVERLIANRCIGLRARQSVYVFRYRQPPPLSEVLQMFADIGQPWVPPAEEICAFARNMQTEIGEFQSGIPSDEMRELSGALRRYCL